MLKQVEIFTDGSCLGNPGPGGFGAIMRYGKHEKIFSAGFHLTTNNRMEMMAAIVALEALTEPCAVVLSTDSQYVRQGITTWKRLDEALSHHQIVWKWVKGHAGHIENERCDELARAAAGNPTSDDIGYQAGA